MIIILQKHRVNGPHFFEKGSSKVFDPHFFVHKLVVRPLCILVLSVHFAIFCVKMHQKQGFTLKILKKFLEL